MEAYSPSEHQSAEIKKVAHLGRVAERIDRIENLQVLLQEEDVLSVVAALRQGGYSVAGDGFEAKSLGEVRAAITEGVEQMEAWNNEVAGLAEAVKNGLVGTVTRPESLLATELSPEQAEYVREAVEAGYERSMVVNRPLIGKKGVSAFPTKEEALKSALTQLTPAQVDYMMEEGRVPFSFQVKLVAPNNRIDLARALLDGQPKKMNTRSQNQQELFVWGRAERHLTGRNDGNSKIEWKWSFYQDQQVIDEVEAWDNVHLDLEDRVSAFKAQLPEGMKGTDRFTWAASMADGLEKGKPMDIRFKGDATDTESYEKWHFTILDEEGELTEGGIRYLVGGDFNPGNRYANLDSCGAYRRDGNARLRAAVDGSIES